VAKLDETYHNLLEDILKNGVEKKDRTGTGTISVFGRQIRHNMQEGFPLLTTKRLHWKSIVHELLWFLRGDTNIQYLKDNNIKIWDEWGDENGNVGPIYGKQWTNWKIVNEKKVLYVDKGLSTEYEIKYINQIQNAIDQLKNNPDSRRIMVNAWNVGELNEMSLPPCHYGFQLYTKELSLGERIEHYVGIIDSDAHPDITHLKLDSLRVPKRRISLMWNQRSVDTFLGLPFNIASYGLLLSIFAAQLNMIPDELIGNLGDCHVYYNHINYVEEQICRDGNKFNLPSISINSYDVSNEGTPLKRNIFQYEYENLHLINYNAYPNWKNVPISV